MSGYYPISFISYAVFMVFASIPIVRAFHYLYGKVFTCHPTKYHLKDIGKEVSELEPGTDYERLTKKILLLAAHNIAVVATTSLVLAVYSSGVFGGGLNITAQNFFAITAVIIVMNSSVRITSLGNFRITTEFYENVVPRSLSFGYSFLLTMYFLAVIGIGTYVISNGLGFTIPSGFGASDRLARDFVILFIAGPTAASIISEILLLPSFLGVQKDDFDSM